MSNALLNVKTFSVTPPAAIIDNAAATTAEIDTIGWDHCKIIVYLGATDIVMTALEVTQSDTSGSGHVLITGADTDGGTNFDGTTAALPSATDDNGIVTFDIDLRGKKRYLDCSATIGNGAAGTYIAILAILSRGEEAPSTLAEAGALASIRV